MSEEQVFLPRAEQINLHTSKCNICKLPDDVRDQVNDLLLRSVSDSKVVAKAEELGHTISLGSVSSHRKYLPHVVSNKQVREIVVKARENVFADLPALKLTEMETQVAETRVAVQKAQEEIKQGIWTTAVPALIRRIQREAEQGVVPIRDLAYAMDILMKNGLLLAGEVTSRTEVTTKDEKHYVAELKSDPESAELLKQLYRRRAGVVNISED
jgi:hypothetical protein